MVTFLAGGTGTPKLLWGADTAFDLETATVIANTGDDVILGGLYVSPDVDSVLFERAGLLDRETWWGLADDQTTTTDELARLVDRIDVDPTPRRREPDPATPAAWRRFAAVPEFMTIGDRDRAHHLVRAALLDRGHDLTAATRALADAYGVDCTVLPVSDDPVVSVIDTPAGRRHFQEFWVAEGGQPAVEGVAFLGADHANPTAAVRAALDEPVVLGPANPVTSIGPMLALAGVREALEDVPVVAVSPFVEDEVFSGPAAKLMQAEGFEASTAGVADALSFVDAFVLDAADRTALDRTVIRTDTHIRTETDAARVAQACHEALNAVA